MERSRQYTPIIEQIRAQLDPGAEKDLFESAILKWKEGQDLKSYQDFLRSMQKLKNNILERMAPTEAVRESSWYDDSRTEVEITWKHRVKYIHQKAYPDQLIEYISAHHDGYSELLPDLKKKWNEWETFYHTNQFVNDPTERDQNVRKVLGFLVDFLFRIRSYIDSTDLHLADVMMIQLVTETLDEYDDETDILPDHEYLINELEVKNVEIIHTDSEAIHLKATGSMEMSLDTGPLLQGEDPPLAGTPYDFPFHIIVQFLLDPDEEEEPFRIEDFQPDIQARTVVVS